MIFLFDVKIFQVKSVLTMMVFSGTLLTRVKVHNIRKSSECLIKFQLFFKRYFLTKQRTTECSGKGMTDLELQEEGDEVETDIQ